MHISRAWRPPSGIRFSKNKLWCIWWNHKRGSGRVEPSSRTGRSVVWSPAPDVEVASGRILKLELLPVTVQSVCVFVCVNADLCCRAHYIKSISHHWTGVGSSVFQQSATTRDMSALTRIPNASQTLPRHFWSQVDEEPEEPQSPTLIHTSTQVIPMTLKGFYRPHKGWKLANPTGQSELKKILGWGVKRLQETQASPVAFVVFALTETLHSDLSASQSSQVHILDVLHPSPFLFAVRFPSIKITNGIRDDGQPAWGPADNVIERSDRTADYCCDVSNRDLFFPPWRSFQFCTEYTLWIKLPIRKSGAR